MTEENLYDHYKETCGYMKEYNAKRDRLTLYLIICLALFVVFLSAPDKITAAINNYINAEKQIIKINLAALNSLLVYVTAYISLQYYQVCLTIERTYRYLGVIEEELSKEEYKITREGKDYAKNYPLLGNIANIFYAWGIPIGAALLAAIRIKTEFSGNFSLKIVDSIGLLFILIISLFYLSDRNLYWEKLVKKDISFCDRIRGFLNIG